MDFCEVFEWLCPEFVRGPSNHIYGDISGLIVALGGRRGVRRMMERYVDLRLAERRRLRQQQERQVRLYWFVCAEVVRLVRDESEMAQVQMTLL